MARGEYFTFNCLDEIRSRTADLGLSGSIGFADDVGPGNRERAISKPAVFGPFVLPNRFAAHPMEGWDGGPETGAPGPDTLRRWERMGASGAGLIWGVEAFAVDFASRANPCQLVMARENTGAVAEGLRRMRSAASRRLVVGAQLTCSGRYSFGRPVPVQQHPVLDARLGEAASLMTDMQMEDMAGKYAEAARTAREAGFDFVDVKACHGYWLNETLAAKTRAGRYGGSFENRTKTILMVVDAVRREVGAGYPLGSRLSMYDGIAFEEDPASRRPGLKGSGRACPFKIPYLWGWGVDESDPLAADPAEPLKLIGMLGEKGVAMFNLTAGSPYSSPHLSRPTETPPADADAYQPPRDPLHEVALHFSLVRAVKEAHPGVAVVGTGYSYLRQFKAHAADFNVREGRADVAGLGRALLAYPDEIRRILEEGEARQERGRVICTGDSACTTGPRFGLKSGCVYDPYYADVNREIAGRLAAMGLNKK